MAIRAIGEANRQAQNKAIYCKLRHKMKKSRRDGRQVNPAVILREILREEELVLSSYTRQGLTAAVRCDRVRFALDQLAGCEALIAGLCIGNLRKMLSEHCKEVCNVLQCVFNAKHRLQMISNYIEKVRTMWSAIFAGLGPRAWQALDTKTVAAVRLLAPNSSRSDQRRIIRLMEGKGCPRIFRNIKDNRTRSQILQNVLTLSRPILDLQTLNEDNKLLRIAMSCTAKLLGLSPSGLVREMDRGSDKDALKVLVGFAHVHVERLEPSAILDFGGMLDQDLDAWRQFAQLAHESGWETNVINQYRMKANPQPAMKPQYTVQARLAAVGCNEFDPRNTKTRQGRPTWRSVIGQTAPLSPHVKRIDSSVTPAFIRNSKLRAYLCSDKEYADVMARIKQISDTDGGRIERGCALGQTDDVALPTPSTRANKDLHDSVSPSNYSSRDQVDSYKMGVTSGASPDFISAHTTKFYSPAGNPFADFEPPNMGTGRDIGGPSMVTAPLKDDTVGVYELEHDGFKCVDRFPINHLAQVEEKYNSSKYILFGEKSVSNGTQIRTKTWSTIADQPRRILVAQRGGGPYNLRIVKQELLRLASPGSELKH